MLDDWRVVVSGLDARAATQISERVVDSRLTQENATLFGYATSRPEAEALAKHIEAAANGALTYVVERWDEELNEWRDPDEATGTSLQVDPGLPVETSTGFIKKLLDTILRAPWP